MKKGLKLVTIAIFIASSSIQNLTFATTATKISLTKAVGEIANAYNEAAEGLTQKSSKSKKTTKIKLTGTSYENITMTVGNDGRTETISEFPYTFEVPKDEMPVRLRFQSDNFLYYDIDVPKKPFDTTGHVYLVKINETAMALNNNRVTNSQPVATSNVQTVANNNSQKNVNSSSSTSQSKATKGFDSSHGINAAPVTRKKNEKTFALIIANEEYDMAANVDNAVSDGLAFKEYCTKTLGIPEENVRYSANMSFGKMRKAVNDALDLVNLFDGEADLLLYYAGHGIPDNQTKDAFLMPIDADGTDTQVCFSLKDLYDKINGTNLNRCVVFLDACFSGAQRGGDMIVAARGVKLKPKEEVPQGKTIVFSATSEDQAAFSHKEERHGLFTYYLLSKLKESKGNVSLGELADYLKQKVGVESRRINNAPQTPTVSIAAGLENTWKTLKLVK